MNQLIKIKIKIKIIKLVMWKVTNRKMYVVIILKEKGRLRGKRKSNGRRKINQRN